jgi:hypothetical protein
MKRLILLPLFVAGFGVVAGAAFAWAGLPSSPPPKPAQAAGPPAAWVESVSRSGWFDFGSYCWKTSCADYLPPATRPALREFRTPIGQILRIHLAFLPKTVSARMLPGKRFQRISAGRIIRWRVQTYGIIELQVKGPGGSASYVLRLG